MRPPRALLLVVGCAVAIIAAASGVARATESPAVLTVTAETIGRPVAPTMFGANERWPSGELGAWNSATNAPDPTMVSLARRYGLQVVRYPGGTVANLFRWKRAIGPQDQRGCQTGGGFVGKQEPMDSQFGPDENGRFAEATGSRTIIMTSSVQSAQDAADFVEYMNAPVGTNPNGGVAWADVRAKNGHPAPYDIRNWEIGNELYLGNQAYWRADQDQLDVRLRQYAFGGTQVLTDEPVGTDCDHRDSAAVSDGTAHQSFLVHWAPIDPSKPSSIAVDGVGWTRVHDLATAGPTDRVYTQDDATGAIVFGDGTHGAIPSKGAVVTATYTSGPHPGFVDYYAAMKKVDPSIDVCTAWGRPEWVRLMGTEHPYDCLAVHLYSHPDKLSHPGGSPADPLAVYNAWQDTDSPANAHNTMGEVRTLHTTLSQVFGPPPSQDQANTQRPFLAITEWGTIAKRGTGPAPRGFMGNSVARTIYGADMMGMMINNSIPYAINSNLNGPRFTYGELFGGAEPTFYWTGRANMLKLYTHLIGTSPVRVNLAGNPSSSTGNYPALSSYATHGADGTTWVMVINHDPEDSVATRLNVEGVQPGSPVTVRIHNGPSLDSYNTPEDQTVIHTTVDTTTAAGQGLTYTFEPHSVTLLQFDTSG